MAKINCQTISDSYINYETQGVSMKTEHIIKAGYVYQNDSKVPLIRFSGRWLEEVGIHVGDIILLSITENGINIEKINPVDLKNQTY